MDNRLIVIIDGNPTEVVLNGGRTTFRLIMDSLKLGAEELHRLKPTDGERVHDEYPTQERDLQAIFDAIQQTI